MVGQIVQLELVNVARVDLREAVTHVLEKRPQLSAVLRGDELPRSLSIGPLR
ncbi:MAG: hypothetical protein JWM12_3168 [Ilumatobacteraceae bacterium]|nr:hypothetical protein [Ilumatobacteraceae bacterium]